MVYSLWGGNEGKTVAMSNTVILTKVKVKSINCVAFTVRSSKQFRVDAIKWGGVSVCDVTLDEIMKTIFSRE